MEHSVCNKDCFNCPYPDCVNNTLDMEDYAEAALRDAALLGDVHPTHGSQSSKSPESRAKASAYRKRYYEEHRERSAEAHRQWYLQNKEKVLATHAQYNEQHRDRIRLASADYVKKQKECDPDAYRARRNEQARRYYQKNKDKLRAQAVIRYRKKTGKEYTVAYWQYAHSSSYGDGFICSICGCWMFADAHKPDTCPTCKALIVPAPPEQGRLRAVRDLSKPELEELRELYVDLHIGTESPATDEVLFKQYGKTLFQDGDFLCNMQEV